MFCIGEVSSEAKKLVDVTKECLDAGLAAVKAWGYLGDVGYAVNTLAQKNGYSVVEEIGGHGVGLKFHEEPYVCHIGRTYDKCRKKRSISRCSKWLDNLYTRWYTISTMGIYSRDYRKWY